MKRKLFYVWPTLAAALAVAGCQPKSSESAADLDSVEIGPKYSAKSGLHVPQETRQSLGLKVVEVTEQKVPGSLEVELRVYREDKETILATAAVALEEASQCKRGMTVRANADGVAFEGSVTGVENTSRQATGLAEVLVALTRTNGASRVGPFLSANVALESEGTVLSLPRAALLQGSDGYSVYTVSGENFVRTSVKVGAMTGEWAEIKDGLYAGDQVVLQPVMSLWMTELAAVKGGQACCVVLKKGK